MPRQTRLQRLSKRWHELPPWGKVTALTGIVIGLTGSVGGIKATWPILRLGLPAIIFYVDSTLEDARGEFKNTQTTTLSVLRDLQIETAEGKRDNAATAIDKFQLDLNKAKDDSERLSINKSIRDQQNTKDKLDAQIKTLNKLRAD